MNLGRVVGLVGCGTLAAAAYAQPSSFTDLGTHTTAETVSQNVHLLAPNDIQWFRIVLPDAAALDGYIDIFITPTTTPLPAADMSDQEIGVYDNVGNLVRSDDDSGPGLFSQLSFGQTAPARPATVITGQTTGLAFSGQGGPLAAGTYWIAVGRYNVTFSAAGWGVTSAYTGTQTDTVLNVRIQPAGSPIPPSGTGAATPATINQGEASLLTVTANPGANPPSTGLACTVNLSALGGSATQTMYDDGTNGDVSAGDNIFSYNFQSTLSTPGGTYSLAWSLSDAESRSASGNLSLRLVVPPQWDETTNGGADAGNLPASAQVPSGTDPFSVLAGFTESNTDVDMYRIRICDAGNFSASSSNPETAGDTQLFLFNDQGLGVTFNDDNPAGGLTSRITAQFIPGNGDYYLALARYNIDPVDEGGQLLWISAPFNVERAPDGPGAAGSVAAWTGTGGSSLAYRIEMTGACFSSTTTPCDPDYNQDGNVDQDDLAYLVNVIGGGENPTNRDPDFNQDGNADQDDYAALVNVVAGGDCP
ncbi:MAG: hypothetical protein IT433_08240 [Phycisphaerales bacterium]|nr:hypothetical protein [Phycisphaerales bacterium]